MSYTSEDWRDHKDYIRKKKAQRRERNTKRLSEVLSEFCLELEERSEYHFSIFDKDENRIDYWPTNSLYHNTKTGERGYTDVEGIPKLFMSFRPKPYSELKGEAFFWGDSFYYSHDDFVFTLAENEETEESLARMFPVKVHGASFEPIIKIDHQKIVDWITDQCEDRFSENRGDTEQKEIYEALKLIDFDAINAKIPKVYYPAKEKYLITLADVIDDFREEIAEE